MSEGASETVLKRKAEAGRSHSGGGTVTPEKALGQALAKAAQDMMKLPLSVASGQNGRMSLGEVIESLPDRALLALLEGPEEGLGLMALAPETLASLIEMQTTGRISTGAVTPRRPTRTDAAMSAPFVDRVLGEFELLLAADAAIVWAGGFRYASYLEDARPLGLLMEDTGYRVFRLTLDFGDGGSRQGGLLLALPSEGKGPPPARCGPEADRNESVAGRANSAMEWQERMQEVVLGVRVQVEAVLDRVSLPLSAVLAMKEGALVPLSSGALSRLRIEGHGRFVAYAKLGQCQGKRAVRLIVTPDEGDKDRAGADFARMPPPALEQRRISASVAGKTGGAGENAERIDTRSAETAESGE